MKSILLFLFNVFTDINQQAFAVDSARSSSSSRINHSVNSADSSFKSSGSGNVATGTEDPAANFATKHKKDKKTSASVVVPSMNSQAPLTSLHLLDLHREFRGSKLFATTPAPDAEQKERLLKKKKDSQNSLKRVRERQEGKGGKSSQSQSQAAAEEAEESNRALQICERDRVELRLERDMSQKELETCEKKVDELKDKLVAPEYLFAQQADECVLGIDDEGNFYLESSKFLTVTEAFTDRPLRMEETIKTSDWFPEKFNQWFENSEDGWPNSAISLVDGDVSIGIYVSAFVFAYARGDGTFGYLLQQSEDQAQVKPLEDLLPSGLTKNTIDHCALFIDGVTERSSTTTPPAKTCDETAPPTDANSCAYYYTKHTALSVKPNPCGPGEMQVSKPPDWWHYCEGNTGACPSGCGTCKKPNVSQGEEQCMCAGNQGTVCTAECGYPGQDDGQTCKKTYCRADDLEKAGCIALGNNCGGSAETKCMDNQGEVSKDKSTCGYTDEPSDSCEAFCIQVPYTDKCETVRWDASSSPVVGMGPCTEHAMTYKDTSGNVNGCCSDYFYGSLSKNECSSKKGIYFVDDQFSRCPSPTVCPYNSEEMYQCGQCSSSSPPTINPDAPPVPDQCCPMAKNRGSEGYPSFFTDPNVPLDASITCQAACACNKNTGYGPPDCYQPGQPWPDWVSQCYCDGHNIAYDKTKFDQCGYYLPIFGVGVLPSQYESYKEYADKKGLDNNYPAPITTMCVPIDDVLTPPSPSGPPSWWDKCANQGGTCPTGCGSCKQPSSGSSQCMCSDSPYVTCTAECGYGQN